MTAKAKFERAVYHHGLLTRSMQRAIARGETESLSGLQKALRASYLEVDKAAGEVLTEQQRTVLA